MRIFFRVLKAKSPYLENHHQKWRQRFPCLYVIHARWISESHPFVQPWFFMCMLRTKFKKKNCLIDFSDIVNLLVVMISKNCDLHRKISIFLWFLMNIFERNSTKFQTKFRFSINWNFKVTLDVDTSVDE